MSQGLQIKGVSFSDFAFSLRLSPFSARLRAFWVLNVREPQKSAFVCLCARVIAFVCFCKYSLSFCPSRGTLMKGGVEEPIRGVAQWIMGVPGAGYLFFWGGAEVPAGNMFEILLKTHMQLGTEKTMTARDVTGFHAFFSSWKSGNSLHNLGRIPNEIAQLEKIPPKNS